MAIRITSSTVADIPPWTYQGKSPSKYTFFEAVALAGLEGKRIRLDAATQKVLLGHPVFGKRAITVDGQANTVTCVISVCFGTDFERDVYPADVIQLAVDHKKQLRPGTSGPKYLPLNSLRAAEHAQGGA